MSFLILVRHGQSEYNLENRFTGNLDIALTELGQHEAKLAGIKLKGYKFDISYTSMLARAQETLRIILEETGETTTPIIKDAALNERMYGSLQGLNKAETAEKYGIDQVAIWRRSYAVSPPGGESLEATYNRTTPYFTNTIAPNLDSGKTVLVVAHGNSLRALMMFLEGIGQEEIASVDIPTGVPRLYTFCEGRKIIDVKYL